METEFNFKSAICTSHEQSERLLALGLKKETADMTWEFSHTKNGEPQYDCRAESSWDSETFARYVEHCEKIGYFEHWKHEDGSQMTPEEVYDEIMKIHIPAWSLDRLRELLKKSQVTLSFFEDGDYVVVERYGVFQNILDQRVDMWDNLCDAFLYLITEGYFNKDYLE